MKTSDIIIEAQSNKIILVDFQPEYDTETSSEYRNALSNVCEYINKSSNVDVLAFFNETQSFASRVDIAGHYINIGELDERKLSNIRFIEKTYAFLRNAMDTGVDDNTIIKILRHMMLHRINDSRDIPDEVLVTLLGTEDSPLLSGDMIYFPDIAMNELKTFSNALMGGGSRHLCFKEMQLLMSAFNIRNKEVQQWIYQ